MSAPRTSTPSYVGIHKRLERERGRAKLWKCGDCGKQADDWAYDHQDENEQVDENGRPYSYDLNHYAPLCVKCHRKFDSKNACRKGHPFTIHSTYNYRGYRLCKICRLENMRNYYRRKSENGS